MSLINEVTMGNCSDVFHFLLNNRRYIKKNQDNVREKSKILQDLRDNSVEITFCAMENQRIYELYSELVSYLK